MRPFSQVDVFSSEPLGGNPVAVVHEASGLSTEQMERFTRWTNLSEATFLLPASDPGADYRVRIFAQNGELSFAGHPTLGTCHAWLQAGGHPRDEERIVQECPAGLVPIRRIDGTLAFQAPPLVRSGPVSDSDQVRLATILGISTEDFVDCQWVDNGPGWVAVMLGSAEAVLTVKATADGGDHLDVGLVGFYPPGSASAYEVRALFSDGRGGIIEDPVTGSLNASLAQWLIGSGRVTPPYTASQGQVLGRRGRPRISQDGDGSIWVGGETVTRIMGEVDIE